MTSQATATKRTLAAITIGVAISMLAMMIAMAVFVLNVMDWRERVCNAMHEVAEVQTNALIRASERGNADEERTPEEQAARDEAINLYREDIESGLKECTP